MTKQLRLLDTQTKAGHPAPSQPYRRLDERTREIGRIGVRDARAALDEANRRVAKREAERIARRDNELAEQVRRAHRSSLTLTQGTGPVAETTEPTTVISSESTGHQSAA